MPRTNATEEENGWLWISTEEVRSRIRANGETITAFSDGACLPDIRPDSFRRTVNRSLAGESVTRRQIEAMLIQLVGENKKEWKKWVRHKSQYTVPPKYLENLKTAYSPFPFTDLTNDLPADLQSVTSAAPATTIERAEVRYSRPDENGVQRVIKTGDINPTPLADLYEQKNKTRVVVFAPPGEGKSTLLRRQVLDWADTGVLPVVVPLGRWEKCADGLRRHLLNVVLPDCDISGDDATAFLQHCKAHPESVAYCFDGLDETPDPAAVVKQIMDWARDNPQARFLVTCRSAVDNGFFKGDGWYRAELQPLAPDAIREYSDKCLAEYPEARENMRRQLDDTQLDHDNRTLALAGSGICLAMLLQLVREGMVELPTSRDDLYHALVKFLLWSDKQRLTEHTYYVDLKQKSLEELSFWFLFLPNEYPPTLERLRSLLKFHDANNDFGIAKSTGKQDELLNDMTERGGMIQKFAAPGMSNRGNAPLRFFHQTLVEYFAAGFIVRQWKLMRAPARNPQTPLPPECVLHHWLPRIWETPAPDANGEVRSWLETHAPEPGGRAGQLPLFRNLPFDPKYREMLLLMVGQLEEQGERVAANQAETWEAWWLKGLARAPYMVDFGLQCLSRCRLDHSALQVSVGRDTILEDVVYEWVTGHLARYGAWHGLAMVSQARDTQNIDQLIRIIINKSKPPNESKPPGSDNRQFAIEVLGEVGVGNADVVAHLLEIAETDPDFVVCWWAIRALGKVGVGNADVVAHLLEIAETSRDSDKRLFAIEALGKVGVGNADIAAHLLEMLTFDPENRWSAIEALGKVGVGNADIAAHLLEIVETSRDSENRWFAIRALGEVGVGNADVVARLFKIAETDPENRWSAIEALGKVGVGNADIAAHLLEMLTFDPENRWSAIEALGKVGVGNADVVAHLLEIVETSRDSENRWFAIRALGEVGVGNADVVARLFKIAETDPENRWSAIWALERLKNNGAFATTMQQLWSVCLERKDPPLSDLSEFWGKIRLTAVPWMFSALERIAGDDHFTPDEKPEWIRYVHEILFYLADFAPEKVEDGAPIARE